VTTPAPKAEKKAKEVTVAIKVKAVDVVPVKTDKKATAPKVTAPKAEEVVAVVAGSEEEDVEDDSVEEEDGDAVEDDQTAALLQGFESSDEEDNSQDEEGLDGNTVVPTLPNDQQLHTKLESAKNKTREVGVIYVGRVPHGFYEHQMRAYFSQFGDIKRLRLSRNKQTGASKHYAFIEFESSEVAQIVADTMDNYLMFGHLLKVRMIPKEQVHKDLFKGAGRRFKAVPWNKIERARLAKTDRGGWDKRTRKEAERRALKAEKLKALGYDYEMSGLRNVDEVPVRAIEAPPAAASEIVEVEEPTKLLPEVSAVEATKTDIAPVAEGTPENADGAKKKRKKSKQTPTVEEPQVVEAVAEAAPAEVTKAPKAAKKAKKSKA